MVLGRPTFVRVPGRWSPLVNLRVQDPDSDSGNRRVFWSGFGSLETHPLTRPEDGPPSIAS